jgi:hypothetical protein
MRRCAVISEGITTFLEFKEKRKEKVGGSVLQSVRKEERKSRRKCVAVSKGRGKKKSAEVCCSQ